MKILLTLLGCLFVLNVHAETTFENFTVADDWPAFEGPGGELMPNIIFPGEFFCTGGGEPVVLDLAPPTFQCMGGDGIHIRNTEMISFLGGSNPEDWRVEGTAWFDFAANWDLDYTGPVFGNWRIDTYTFMQDPDTYWEGTYTGKREFAPSPIGPTWITTLKFRGYGMGDLAGQQLQATEVVTTFTPIPLPYELLGVGLLGPEGHVEITLITH